MDTSNGLYGTLSVRGGISVTQIRKKVIDKKLHRKTIMKKWEMEIMTRMYIAKLCPTIKPSFLCY